MVQLEKAVGLAKPTFFDCGRHDESGGCPFELHFFAIWEEVEELDSCFLSQAQNKKELDVVGRFVVN